MRTSKNLLVSIITPVYNCKKFLDQCVNSILSQSFSNFELLLIDDGSVDGAGEICDFYSQRDHRVKVYHKANGGVSSARNLGLRESEGDWVLFVDADDILKFDALSVLIGELQPETGFAMSGYEYIQNETIIYTTLSSSNKEYSATLSRDEGITKMFTNDYWAWFICSKLFRREILEQNNIAFDESLFHGEDRLFIMNYLCSMNKKITIHTIPVYSYRIHSESVEGRGYCKYNEKNLTGFIATVKMFHTISCTHTTNLNKYLMFNDLINSYSVQLKMIRQCDPYERREYKAKLDKILYEYISPIEYFVFRLLRRCAFGLPVFRLSWINYWCKRYEKRNKRFYGNA